MGLKTKNSIYIKQSVKKSLELEIICIATIIKIIIVIFNLFKM